MNTLIKALLAAALFSVPIAAFAQSSDADYCKALVAKFEQYLDMDSKKAQRLLALLGIHVEVLLVLGDQRLAIVGVARLGERRDRH